MKIRKEVFENLENYMHPEMISTRVWRPFTIEQLELFLKDIDFSEHHTVKATFGDEIHLFIGDIWAYSVIRYQELFYIRKVGLPYEEWIAYVSTRSFPIIFAPWAIIINIWRYWVRKYGLARAIMQQIATILAWWISGLVSVIIFRPDLIRTNPLISVLLPLVIGVIMGFIVGSFQGLLISVLFLISSLYIVWRLLIYQKKRKIIIKDPFEAP